MDIDKKSGISRRDFINTLWGFVAAMPFLYSSLKFISPPKKHFTSTSQKLPGSNNTYAEISLDSFSINSSKTLNIDGEPVLIIRRSETDIIALSAVCTHLNCVVGFRKESADIYCACHGGRYDMDGNVIEGPPKEALTKYIVVRNADKITVSPIS